ncbi:hypothetical protein E7744_02760 [Citricoccus sp. SGAir0253]|uniref:hypothetical protein n=1 Tax=Citricoccus sp. SGAir0253 TaxID=2567881 RepID=UPI0010CD5FD3|nr:hypothetical protein [Citricoccus sp. SGAir0253]QCU77257.1 hypothetical protein E7744_02760 [Citricoccus sp. SGAir0253]
MARQSRAGTGPATAAEIEVRDPSGPLPPFAPCPPRGGWTPASAWSAALDYADDTEASGPDLSHHRLAAVAFRALCREVSGLHRQWTIQRLGGHDVTAALHTA